MRKRSMDLYVKMGGLDKLNVRQSAVVNDGAPTALQTANLGLRNHDADEGNDISASAVEGISVQKNARARVRSPFADRERDIRGIGGDFLAIDGYEIEEGRNFSAQDMDSAAPVALLGAEAVSTFFPDGRRRRTHPAHRRHPGPGRRRPARARVPFPRRASATSSHWRNRIIALPTALVARRFEGDQYHRVDRVTFRIRNLDAMATFSKGLSSMLKANHRQQEDFRLDDVAARVRKQQSQGDVYDIIFMLSGFLSLIGGGIVNVNIQMATLKERVREVGVKMAIGAPGREVFKEFMTEALLLTSVGSVAGLFFGVAFSKLITSYIGVPLHIDAKSFALGVPARRGVRIRLRPLPGVEGLAPLAHGGAAL